VSTRRAGFTMLEMMVVLGVVAILVLLALPTYQDKFIRDQIVEALPLADIAKKPVAASWTALRAFPADNAAAGLPSADRIVNNFVSAIAVEHGARHVRQSRERPAQGQDPHAASGGRRGRADRPGRMGLRTRGGAGEDDGQRAQQDRRAEGLSAASLPMSSLTATIRACRR
jgi:prepilin-type N-terminal cleavage/methylation domain-containing protein